MSAINDGGPAFPPAGTPNGGPDKSGTTLRDYFAAKAMQGMVSLHGSLIGEEPMEFPLHNHVVAENAYEMADAMLAARGTS